MSKTAEFQENIAKSDLHRPSYHFMPIINWMNDPNGPIFYHGEYHMFYQYNPNGSQWGTIHWGHASSKDLVHWRHWPVALYPSYSLGEAHCFSGCIVMDDGVPKLLYTSVGTGERDASVGAEQWMATSDDGLLTWKKNDRNPILTGAVHGNMAIREWRDPFAWHEDGTWYMVLGGCHDGRGCALLYRSKDLVEWEFLKKMLDGPDVTWECPNLFRLGSKHVLVYSPSGPVRYHVGTLNADFSFTSEQEGWIDRSGWEGYYAPNSMVDDQDRRIMWGWITENARGEFRPECGWAGVHSLPRVLTLGSDNRLRMHPVKELSMLRRRHWQVGNVILTDREFVPDAWGRALEMVVQVEVSADAAPVFIKVLRSVDGQEETAISFNPSTEELSIDRSKSSLSELPHKSKLSGSLTPLERILTLHIYVDHSVVEVFANYEECISTRVFPTRADAIHISLCGSAGKPVILKTMDVWELASIWE